MKTILKLYCAGVLMTGTLQAENMKCYKEAHLMEKECVQMHANQCEEDWSNAIFIGGACLDFSMQYDTAPEYRDMAMIAWKRAMLMAKYEGGAYMSYYPTVDMDFEEKARKAKFKNIDSMDEKSLSMAAYQKYLCGDITGKACKEKIDVLDALNGGVFNGAFHPYYRKHPNKKRLTKKEQKRLMRQWAQEVRTKKLYSSDNQIINGKKWVDILIKEGKVRGL